MFQKGNKINKGRKQSEKTRKKKSEIMKRIIREKGGHWNKGHIPWNKNIPMEEEIRLKVSKNRKGKGLGNQNRKGKSAWNKNKRYEQILGEKHWWWKGGLSKQTEKGYFSFEYRQWRMKCLERDNWTCQFCGIKCHIGLGKTIYLTVHHIKSWKNYPELRFEIDNGITLCEKCHSLTDNYKGRNNGKKHLLK